MGYNRYLKHEKLKRQYTFTRTKMFIGFLLSTVFSIVLSPYFDMHGPAIVREVIALF